MEESVVERVKNLFKMPQSLCRQCGQCCRVVCFKGGLSYEELIEALKKENASDADNVLIEGIKDFLTLFRPYKSNEEAREKNPSFVEKFRARVKNYDENKHYFYCCKFLDDDNRCLIHEDRPTLCRLYPLPHERTIFYDNCGYEQTAKKNIKEISDIIERLKKGEIL